MPYKSDSIKIAGTKYDSRAKLNQDERHAVKILTEKGYSQRKLADMFGVSRRLIQSIIKPPVRSPAPKRSAEYWREAKRRYRKRKNELYKTGKIHAPKNITKNIKKVKAYPRKHRRDKD